MTREEKESRVRALSVNRHDLQERRDALSARLYSWHASYEPDPEKRQEIAADVGAVELALAEVNEEYNDLLYPGWRERMSRLR
jgi:hypothetical protein